MAPQKQILADGRRHFSHGPIDLIIAADGAPEALAEAHQAAWERFGDLLPELVAELAILRRPLIFGQDCPLQGRVAQRMWQACQPLARQFITPMAAVAGAVAQEICACYQRPGILRAAVNNGGDIALHLTPGASWKVALCADLQHAVGELIGAGGPQANAMFLLDAAMPVRGLATSGWRGRSFSLGIADSVTVLAASAPAADAAATIIANAVDINDSRIVRASARTLKDDTDLGDLAVTLDVPALEPELLAQAVARGAAKARELQEQGLVFAVALVCQEQYSFVEPLSCEVSA